MRQIFEAIDNSAFDAVVFLCVLAAPFVIHYLVECYGEWQDRRYKQVQTRRDFEARRRMIEEIAATARETIQSRAGFRPNHCELKGDVLNHLTNSNAFDPEKWYVATEEGVSARDDASVGRNKPS